MQYVTDRQRVERMMLPYLMRSVVEKGAVDPSHETVTITRKLFIDAEHEVLLNVSEKERYKLVRRMLRVVRDVIGPYEREGSSVAKVGLIIFYVLKALTDSDYLMIHEGSPMDQALSKTLPALEPSANIDKLDTSAKKASAKVLKAFQSYGYFQGVPI